MSRDKIHHEDGLVGELKPLFFKARQPLPSIVVFLGAIFFLPFVFGIFMATPSLSSGYLLLVTLTLMCGICLFLSLGMATRKYMLSGDSIVTRSLIGRSEIGADEVSLIAYWVRNYRDGAIGCIDLDTGGRVIRVRINAEDLDAFMLRLLTICQWTYVVDCDHRRMLSPDSDLQDARVNLIESIARLKRVFYVDLAKHLSVLAVIVGVGVYIVVVQGVQQAVPAMIPLSIAGLPAIVRSFYIYRRSRGIQKLIVAHQHSD